MLRCGLLYLSGLAVIQSCITPVEFATTANEGDLAVFGQMSQDTGAKYVRLTRTTGFKDGIRVVNDAGVSLYEDNAIIAKYVRVDSGLYRIAQFKATPGRSYFIRIEQGGGVYQSEPEILNPPVEIDSASVRLANEYTTNEFGVTLTKPIWQIYAATSLPADQEVYLRWGSIYAYSFYEDNACFGPFGGARPCYFIGETDPLTIAVFSKTSTDAINRLDQIKVATRAVSKIEVKEREYFGALQYRISKKTFQYWQKTNQQNNQTGSIFDAVAGSVPGNIYNIGNKSERVLGLFEIGSVSKAYTFITNGDAPPGYIGSSCADFEPGSQNGYLNCNPFTSPCKNCLLLKNASRHKPDFWP